MFSPPRQPVASFCSSSPSSALSTLTYSCRGPTLPPIQPLTPETSAPRTFASLPAKPGFAGKREISSLSWLPTSLGYAGGPTMGTAYETSTHPHLSLPYEDLNASTAGSSQPQRALQGLTPRLTTLQPPRAVNFPPQHFTRQQQLQCDRDGLPAKLLNAACTTALQYPYSSSSTSPASNKTIASELSKIKETRRKRDDLLIHASSQIPAFIDPGRGSIADFAAQMTCLFWFESIETLRAAEKYSNWSKPVPRLTKYAWPEEAFKKWVGNILSTTQVTQNVILLALCFIYKLKMLNPSVWGRPGSEYRLLTVALMLGNKFLDDNTYTNKTWAEVSCIGVQEIHVMEVEFLSNMRYTLLVTREEWDEWLDKLSIFLQYCARAGGEPTPQLPPPTILPVSMPASTQTQQHSPLPSPTHLKPLMQPIQQHFQQPHNFVIPTGMPPSAPLPGSCTTLRPLLVSNAASPPPFDYSSVQILNRKRSAVEDSFEHPAKRPARQAAVLPPLHSTAAALRPPPTAPALRLQVPSLSLVTNQAQGPYQATNPSYPSQDSVFLPPMNHGVRAMSTVYASSGGLSQLSYSTTTPTHTTSHHNNINPVSAGSAIGGFRTPTKHRSPGQLSATYGSSPLIESFSSSATANIHTPITYHPSNSSPSIYLQHRASPYKPVRHVNTLLCPPLLTPVNEYPLSMMTPSQMYYQPIGRRYDVRTGIVPDFVMTPGRTAMIHQNQNRHQGQTHVAYTPQ